MKILEKNRNFFLKFQSLVQPKNAVWLSRSILMTNDPCRGHQLFIQTYPSCCIRNLVLDLNSTKKHYNFKISQYKLNLSKDNKSWNNFNTIMNIFSLYRNCASKDEGTRTVNTCLVLLSLPPDPWLPVSFDPLHWL